MGKSTCTVDGCDRVLEAKGLCATHYMRTRRNGDLVLRRAPNGHALGRYRKPNGYWALKRPSHPLAAPSSGLVYEHRAVLFDALGPSDRPCHWCGLVVSWMGSPRLEVDHLDGDRANNQSVNLVPACRSCNALRGNATRWAA